MNGKLNEYNELYIKVKEVCLDVFTHIEHSINSIEECENISSRIANKFAVQHTYKYANSKYNIDDYLFNNFDCLTEIHKKINHVLR